MEIKLTGTPSEIAQELSRLNATFNPEPKAQDKPVDKPVDKKAKKPEPKKKAKKPEPKKKAKKPEPKKPEPKKPEPDLDDAPDDAFEGELISYAKDVKPLFIKLACFSDVGRTEAKKLVKGYGVKKGSEIPVAKLPELKAKIKEKLEEIDAQ